MKISFLLPSRSRPEKLFSAIENIQSMVVNDSYEIILSLDLDDKTMNNDEVKDRLRTYSNLTYYFDFSEGKTHAINREVNKCSGEIIVVHSDDMVITKKGFDNYIREAFADGFVGLAHFPDQLQLSRLCTYPVLHADYIKEDGWIYHPRLWSVYTDNLQQELAKKRGKYKYVPNEIIEHQHYRGGYGTPDFLMQRNDNPIVYAKDFAVYKELKKEFGLD